MSRNRQHSSGPIITSSKTYGQIHKLTKLGSGGFSDVYLTYSPVKNELLACKRIKRNSKLSTTAFTAELETFNISKNCPFLVSFKDCCYDDQYVYFFSELIFGGTLNTRSSNFTNNHRFHISSQLCQALFFLHYRQIAHLDVKPENILVVQENPVYIKLHDYGISKNEITMDFDSYQGTPLYMAPEMLLKFKKLDYYKCDSFSTGLVLFELFSKKLPSSHQNVNSRENLASRYVQLMETNGSIEQLSVSEKSNQNPDLLSKMFSFINNLLTINPESRHETTKILNFLPSPEHKFLDGKIAFLNDPPPRNPNYQKFFQKNFTSTGIYFQYLKLKFSHDPVTTTRLDNIGQAHVFVQDWKYRQALELYTENFGPLLATAKNVIDDELRAGFKEFLKIVMGEAECLKQKSSAAGLESSDGKSKTNEKISKPGNSECAIF